jgi:hypothetical protein
MNHDGVVEERAVRSSSLTHHIGGVDGAFLPVPVGHEVDAEEEVRDGERRHEFPQPVGLRAPEVARPREVVAIADLNCGTEEPSE